MTKTEVLKELFKNNFNEIIRYIFFGLKIDFKDDEFIILDKDDKIIFKNKILNYDLDYEGQIKFLKDVVSEITLFMDVIKDPDYYSYDAFIDTKFHWRNYSNILGNGYIRKKAKCVKVKFDIEYDDEDFDYDKYSELYSNEYNQFMKDVISKIKENLDEDKINVVLYSDGYVDEFYVDGALKYSESFISYIEDSSKFLKGKEYKDDILRHMRMDYIFIYYIDTTEKEIEEAVEFIEKLVKKS